MQKAIGKTEYDYGILAVCSFTQNVRQGIAHIYPQPCFFSAPEF